MTGREGRRILQDNGISIKQFASRTGRNELGVYRPFNGDKPLPNNIVKTIEYMVEIERILRGGNIKKYDGERITNAEELMFAFRNTHKKRLATILGIGIDSVYLISSKRVVSKKVLATANIYLELEYLRKLTKKG